MPAEGRLLQEIQLDNGLTIYFHDQSKAIVGNRWQLTLKITVPMVVKEEYFSECSDPRGAFHEFTAAFGSTVDFALEKVRNFVGDNEAAVVMEQMTQEFLESNRAYISNAKFPGKFILKKYIQWKEEAGYRKSHIAAIKKADPEV